MKNSVFNFLKKVLDEPLAVTGIILTFALGFTAWLVFYWEIASANINAITIGVTAVGVLAPLIISYPKFFVEFLRGISIIIIWAVLRFIWMFVDLYKLFKKFFWMLKVENWPTYPQFWIAKAYVGLVFLGLSLLACLVLSNLATQELFPLVAEISFHLPFIVMGIGFLICSRNLRRVADKAKNDKIGSIIFGIGVLLTQSVIMVQFQTQKMSGLEATIWEISLALVGTLILLHRLTPSWKEFKERNTKVVFTKGNEHLAN